jgi:hypothetical protein
VKAPPRRGPATDATPNILESIAIYRGRRLKGTVKPIIVIPPEKSAEAPAPAIARPKMSMTELVAAAQIMEPTSKSMAANIYVYLTLK